MSPQNQIGSNGTGVRVGMRVGVRIGPGVWIRVRVGIGVGFRGLPEETLVCCAGAIRTEGELAEDQHGRPLTF